VGNVDGLVNALRDMELAVAQDRASGYRASNPERKVWTELEGRDTQAVLK
jgi:hypothetical protein